MYHTIGQRQGLGIGGLANYAEAPWYVVSKNVEQNILVVAQGVGHPSLFHRRLKASGVLWVSGTPPQTPLRCHAKIRYRQPDQGCSITRVGQDYEVAFDEPQRAVTPGQSVVFYDRDICLGGGVIERAL
jgi:tRNA-specific 2-thiouridylase